MRTAVPSCTVSWAGSSALCRNHSLNTRSGTVRSESCSHVCSYRGSNSGSKTVSNLPKVTQQVRPSLTPGSVVTTMVSRNLSVTTRPPLWWVMPGPLEQETERGIMAVSDLQQPDGECEQTFPYSRITISKERRRRQQWQS